MAKQDQMRTPKKGLADKVGDVVERVGQKISDAGAKGVGQKIHDAGDRIERTHADKNHPEKV